MWATSPVSLDAQVTHHAERGRMACTGAADCGAKARDRSLAQAQRASKSWRATSGHSSAICDSTFRKVPGSLPSPARSPQASAKRMRTLWGAPSSSGVRSATNSHFTSAWCERTTAAGSAGTRCWTRLAEMGAQRKPRPAAHKRRPSAEARASSAGSAARQRRTHSSCKGSNFPRTASLRKTFASAGAAVRSSTPVQAGGAPAARRSAAASKRRPYCWATCLKDSWLRGLSTAFCTILAQARALDAQARPP
mmetsp:Transcript_104158/g.334097  ORF Transcript_104158/g.334097 Transcript_104158/m.334097 type:complete len:251 (+) Transcript_104158:2284-3036(+)